MDITKNDVHLLKYLHAVKVATYKQIQRDIYPSYQLRSVSNRLAKLERLSLVTGSQNRLFRCVEKVISLSKSGYQRFVAGEIEHRCELKSEAINHDLRLVDVRYAFLRLEKVSQYQTENQIQTWGIPEQNYLSAKITKLNSDAMAKVKFPGGEILAAIEYEESEKATQRYDPIVKKYYLCEEVGVVFYVCESRNLIRKISEVEKSLFPGNHPKFFYQVIDGLLQNDDVSFQNYNKFELRLAAKAPDEQVMIS